MKKNTNTFFLWSFKIRYNFLLFNFFMKQLCCKSFSSIQILAEIHEFAKYSITFNEKDADKSKRKTVIYVNLKT